MVVELTQVKNTNMDGYYVETLYVNPKSVTRIEPYANPILEERMAQKGIKATAGYTSIRVDGETFIVVGHPKQVSAKLNSNRVLHG